MQLAQQKVSLRLWLIVSFRAVRERPGVARMRIMKAKQLYVTFTCKQWATAATHLCSTPGQQQLKDSHHQALLFWCTTCNHQLHSPKNFPICVFFSRAELRPGDKGSICHLVHHFTMEMSGVGKLSVATGLYLLFYFSPLPLSCKFLTLSRCPAPGRYTAGKIFLKYCFPWSAYFAWIQTEHF